MASHTVTRAKHSTLSGSTVDTITIAGVSSVEVYNRDSTTDLYASGDGTTPTVGGDNTDIVPPNSAVVIELSSGVSAVKIIGSNNAYSVTAVTD